jgi:hypothetical protein
VVDEDDGEPGDGRPDLPRPLLIACVLIVLEALGLLGAVVVVVYKAATEKSHSLAGALLLAAVALCGVVVLVACARGLARLSPAARTPVVVLEVLAVPVSYSLGFQAGKYVYGAPILVAALAVLYLLFTPPARAVLDREDPVR